MIKILMVEDDNLKAQKISSLLIDNVSDVTKENIDLAQDIISAKKMLGEKCFDLILLDINIPNRFDQTPKMDGGIKLLKELKINKKYYMPSHIIGITSYPEVFEKAVPIFSEDLLTVVKYDESLANWGDGIVNKVNQIISSNRSPSEDKNKYDYDLAIICALDTIELTKILDLPFTWTEHSESSDPNCYYRAVFSKGDRSVKIIAGAPFEMGMPASTALAMKMIYNFKPKYIGMSGIVAGIKGEVNLGDILVADPAWDYGSGKLDEEVGKPVFKPDPRQRRLDDSLKAFFVKSKKDNVFLSTLKNSWSSSSPETELKIHIGPIASGSTVLAHSATVKEIKKFNRKLIGIEMETYGIFFAAINAPTPRPLPFSIKSVCDFADKGKNDKYQDYAAFTSAGLFEKFIREEL